MRLDVLEPLVRIYIDYSDMKLGNLDLAGGSSANGTKIQGWATYDNDNQKWFITDAGNGYWK